MRGGARSPAASKSACAMSSRPRHSPWPFDVQVVELVAGAAAVADGQATVADGDGGVPSTQRLTEVGVPLTRWTRRCRGHGQPTLVTPPAWATLRRGLGSLGPISGLPAM